MIWTLWVISSIAGIEEPKWTMYDNYETAIECYQAWHEVTITFENEEVAFCDSST